MFFIEIFPQNIAAITRLSKGNDSALNSFLSTIQLRLLWSCQKTSKACNFFEKSALWWKLSRWMSHDKLNVSLLDAMWNALNILVSTRYHMESLSTSMPCHRKRKFATNSSLSKIILQIVVCSGTLACAKSILIDWLMNLTCSSLYKYRDLLCTPHCVVVQLIHQFSKWASRKLIRFGSFTTAPRFS